MEKKNKMIGAAGEYYVAYLLSKRGYIVSPTRTNSPAIDLLVGNPEGTKTRGVQVKTSHRAKRGDLYQFEIGWKVAHEADDNISYVFVDLKDVHKKHANTEQEEEDSPRVFIVPAADIKKQWAELDKKIAEKNGPDYNPGRYMLHIEKSDVCKFLNNWKDITEKLD